MSTEQSANEISAIVTEALGLLSHLTLDLHQGVYLRGKTVSILAMPTRVEHGDRFDVPITVRPLRSRDVSALAGTPVTLWRLRDQSVTWYGRLNRNGQILFRNLERGTYEMQVVQFASASQASQPTSTRPVESVQRTIEDRLIPLPRMNLAVAHARSTAVAHARSTADRWQHICQSASGSLKAIFWKQVSGELELDFEVQGQAHDGAVVMFQWTPQPGGEKQILLTPLVWSDRDRACVAQMNLGWAPEVIDSAVLPEQSLPPEALADVPVAVLRASVGCAARAQTRRAWRRLVEEHSQTLSSEARDAINQALTDLRGSF